MAKKQLNKLLLKKTSVDLVRSPLPEGKKIGAMGLPSCNKLASSNFFKHGMAERPTLAPTTKPNDLLLCDWKPCARGPLKPLRMAGPRTATAEIHLCVTWIDKLSKQQIAQPCQGYKISTQAFECVIGPMGYILEHASCVRQGDVNKVVFRN